MLLEQLREIVWQCNLDLPRNGLVKMTSGNVSGREREGAGRLDIRQLAEGSRGEAELRQFPAAGFARLQVCLQCAGLPFGKFAVHISGELAAEAPVRVKPQHHSDLHLLDGAGPAKVPRGRAE